MMSSTIKTQHGGARPGAGRKPKTKPPPVELPVALATQRCTDRLSHTLKSLERSANGVESVTETWVLAATLTTGTGPEKRPLYPDAAPDQLVLVSRKITHPRPDTRAATYLADRALGRPRGNDAVQVDEIVSAELKLFIEKVKDRFPHDVAQAIFRTLTAPDDDVSLPVLTVASGTTPGNEFANAAEPAAPAPGETPFRLE